MEEITELAMEDPIVRKALQKCKAGRLRPKFKERELFIAVSRAVISVDNIEIHEIWGPLLPSMDHADFMFTFRDKFYFGHESLDAFLERLKKSLRYGLIPRTENSY